MTLDDLLIYIDDYSKANDYKIFIVGGAVRDHFLFPNSVPSDLDLTSGNKKIYKLGYDLSKKFPGVDYLLHDDGHAALVFENFRIDFSNNFTSRSVYNWLIKREKNISSLKHEMFSRDFTMNTLLMDLKRTTIWDMADGIRDINAKIIRCPVHPLITLLDDPKRMLRAVKYSIKFGFVINEAEEKVIKKYASKVRDLPINYVKKIVGEILELNQEEGIKKLYELNLLKNIPLTKKLTEVLTENRELAKYFE